MTMTLTTTTCAANCWLAKEDVCRCMCGGANHGALLIDGTEQPTRTMSRQGRRFELVALHGNWLDANRDRDNTSKAFNEEHNLQWFNGHNTESALMMHVSKSQRKWPEVRNFLAEESNLDAYLVWRKIW